MRKVLLFLLLIFFLMGCSKAATESSMQSESEVISSEISVVASAEESEEQDVLPPIETDLEKYTETYNVDELLASLQPYSKTGYNGRVEHWDLCAFDWYRDYPNKDRINYIKEHVESTIHVDGLYSSFFPLINNEVPIEDVITECAIETIFTATDHTQAAYQAFGTTPDFWWNRQYPIVFFRQTAPSNYYTVYKLADGGWVYYFYYHVPHDTEEPRVFTECDDETHVCASGCIYMENILSYSDFENVYIGDHIDVVNEIDSCVEVYRLASECIYDVGIEADYRELYLESRHLLTDGLLTIIYEKIDDEWYVYDMNFSEEFHYTSHLIEEYFYGITGFVPTNTFYKVFKILPQDYPPVD